MMMTMMMMMMLMVVTILTNHASGDKVTKIMNGVARAFSTPSARRRIELGVYYQFKTSLPQVDLKRMATLVQN
jgi:hypothetical protein